MDRLLFVDDEPFVLKALKRTFALEGFEVVTAERPADALEMLQENSDFGSDYRMPEMNGAEFLQRARQLAPQSYRLLISAVEEFHAAVDAINRGEIYRFVPKPWDRDDLLHIVRGAVDDFHLRRKFQEMTALLHSKNTELASMNKTLEQRVADRTHDLLEALVTALDQRGAESVHSRRLAAWCVRLGWQLDLSPEQLAIMEQGALIHDVGKIGIPDSILLKGAQLTPEEWEQMKRHPEVGYRMLANIPFLDEARKLVLTHHERWDGGGYPLGLAGAAIPRSARILHVCEAYESIAHGRNFRPARGPEEARGEIARCSGTQFDPEIVAAFLAIPGEEWEEVGRAAVAPGPPPVQSLQDLKASLTASR